MAFSIDKTSEPFNLLSFSGQSSTQPQLTSSNTSKKTSSVFQTIISILSECQFPIDVSKLVYEYFNQVYKISILANTIDFILLELPPGKPDPKSLCTPETLLCDSRPRVVQNAYKSNTCGYYALNTVRNRIGKNPSSELIDQRYIEQHCSERRKKLSKHEDSLPDVFDQINDPKVKSLFSKWNKKNIGTAEPYLKLFDSLSAKASNSLRPYIKDFCLQSDSKSFYDYVEFRKMAPRAELNDEFFKKVKRNPEVMYEEARLIDPVNYNRQFGNLKWKDLRSEDRLSLNDRYAMTASSESYGLKKSFWSPCQSIDMLINSLKKQGPLVVAGFFGNPMYSEEPTKMKMSFKGLSFFSWRPGTRVKDKAIGHVITIIGAQKLGTGLVFYVDPVDSSDPKKTQAQKIYVISYKALIENVVNLSANWLGDAVESPAGYAWVPNNFTAIG